MRTIRPAAADDGVAGGGGAAAEAPNPVSCRHGYGFSDLSSRRDTIPHDLDICA